MGRRPAGDSSRNALTVDMVSRNDQNQLISCNQFVVTNSRLSEITVLGELDQPSNVTEYLCAGFSCVPLGHVEALLQYKIDPISQYVCFLEFASVTFVIVPSSRVEEHENSRPHVQGNPGLRPGIIFCDLNFYAIIF